MRTLTLTLCAAAVLSAEPLRPSALDELADRLGSGDFKERTVAEKSLAEVAELEPEATRAALQKRLELEEDPEIRNRIGRILKLIGRILPLETLEFSKEGLDAKTWEQLGDEPGRVGFELDEGLLEFDSTDRPGDTAMFGHRFAAKAVEGAALFGPAPPAAESERLTLDAEIKILEQSAVRRGLAGMHLNIEDHRASYALMILEDGVFAYRSGSVHKMDTTDRWHHYRFVIEGDIQRIFVDDMEKPVVELARPKDAGRRWATFGDGTSGGGAHAQIRNVTFTRFGE